MGGVRPSHAVRLFGLRFVDRDTEREYRQWRVDASIPFARVGYLGSAPSWTLLLLSILVLDREAASPAVWWVAAWIVLLVVLTALSYPARLRRTVMPLAALANGLAGVLVAWLLAHEVLTDQAPQARAGVMTAGVIVVMLFGFAIFRVPPGVAVAAVTPYVCYASYTLLQGHLHAELSVVEAGSLAAAQWIAYLGGLLVCVVVETVDRRTFRKDQVIAAQQHELHASRETIRRYVPRPVVEHIVQGNTVDIDVPTRRRVTVLFADLAGFTALADRVEGEVLTEVVKDYMTAMSETVDAHGGVVNEFAGDGLMALFGAPDHMDDVDQAVSAVRAALAMQAQMPTLSRRWARVGVTSPMHLRVGINTGVLSVGSFGSIGRMTYTAIGLQTNIAARLQASCEPGRVLLSDTTWHLVRDVIACEPRGEVHCKGVHYPVSAYSPLLVSSVAAPTQRGVAAAG